MTLNAFFQASMSSNLLLEMAVPSVGAKDMYGIRFPTHLRWDVHMTFQTRIKQCGKSYLHVFTFYLECVGLSD
eukprot:scaffold282_cov345-Pavlova_lutheri.AAC.37